jgi:hypothetical protein
MSLLNWHNDVRSEIPGFDGGKAMTATFMGTNSFCGKE